MIRSRIACALAAGLMTFLAAAGEAAGLSDTNTARSVSGQFLVSTIPNNSFFYRRPDFSTNADIIHLEAPLLAVSAEHFKTALRRELGIAPDSSWSGRIFLRLHPAHSLDEPVLIASQPFVQLWDYRVELPDLVSQNRYARALSAVLLLEIANRKTPVTGQSAEIPGWLVDGLARQILTADKAKVILSAPTNFVQGIALNRLDEKQRGLDPLAAARRVLQNFPALTFDQLSWPNDAQLTGKDDGVYLASAQLFVNELLDLKNGPAKMRALLAQLPACRNWQSAFFSAFHADFRSPLDLEKWWALRVVAFAAHVPGPQWTLAVSREKLDSILSVPVEIRSASNALPSRAEISLQSAIQNFEPPRRTAILQTKLRDLDLVQLRVAPQLASVVNDYRTALADFLGERKKKTFFHFTRRSTPAHPGKADVAAMLKKLDALDERRRQAEATLDNRAIHLPGQ